MANPTAESSIPTDAGVAEDALAKRAEGTAKRAVIIGDIHLFELMIPPWALLNKRLLGATNLWLNRRHAFDHALMASLIQRTLALEPDIVLLPGDLTTTAMEIEFRAVARMFRPLTERFETIAVPGNHDRYTFNARRVRRMETVLPEMVPQRFPAFYRFDRRWSVLAMDGAWPRMFTARGRVGDEQLHAAHQYVRMLTEREGLIVLCHYPIKTPLKAPPITWDHAMADAGRLRKMLRRCAARVLYVHGHIHRAWCWQPRQARHGGITYLNAGAPCLTSGTKPLGQGFWHVDLPENPTDQLAIVHHRPWVEQGVRVPRKRRKGGRVDHWESHHVL